MTAHLEAQRRAVRIADVDPQSVVDLGHRHATVVDVQAVEAPVVDREPSALVESHEEVSSRDQGVRDADVGAQVAPDDYVITRRESAVGSLVAHGQHRGPWSAHER